MQARGQSGGSRYDLEIDDLFFEWDLDLEVDPVALAIDEFLDPADRVAFLVNDDRRHLAGVGAAARIAAAAAEDDQQDHGHYHQGSANQRSSHVHPFAPFARSCRWD